MKISESQRTARKRFLRVFAGIVIVKVTLAVIWNNRNYFPPDFQSDFLIGRKLYFGGIYQYAFFSHVVAGPISLLLGMMLISTNVRRRWPKIHRRLGQVQVIVVGLVVAPSGLIMAGRAIGGSVAIAGFTVLSVLTAATVVMGYVSALQRNFRQHERMMFRCFLLLVSAVTLRLMSGAAIVVNVDAEWIYPTLAWISWLLPVGVYEAHGLARTR